LLSVVVSSELLLLLRVLLLYCCATALSTPNQKRRKLDFIEDKQNKPLKTHDLTNKGHEYLSSDDKNDFLFKIVDRTYGGLSEIVDILKKNGGLDLKGIRGRLSNTPNKDPLSRRLQMLKALHKIIYHDHKYAHYSSTTFPKTLDTSKDTSSHKLANYLKFHYHIEVKYERKGCLTFFHPVPWFWYTEMIKEKIITSLSMSVVT
jgi:hypothetical protein